MNTYLKSISQTIRAIDYYDSCKIYSGSQVLAVKKNMACVVFEIHEFSPDRGISSRPETWSKVLKEYLISRVQGNTISYSNNDAMNESANAHGSYLLPRPPSGSRHEHDIHTNIIYSHTHTHTTNTVTIMLDAIIRRVQVFVITQ